MHSDLEKMIVLQQLDLEAARLAGEMAEAPKRVVRLAGELDAAKRQQAQTNEKLAGEESLRRKLELDIRSHQEKAARLRKQMDMVTTTGQAAALEHEITFATKEVTRLEDEELASMERSETLELERSFAEETVANLTRRHAAETSAVEELIARDRAEAAEVGTKRAAVRAEIGEDSLLNYDRIARGRGTALAEAVDQKCSACQMMVRPQSWNDLRDRDNNEMLTCETCGRILYRDPARDAPQKKPAERQESIAASIVRAL
jgi:predicted  nucleic acid-binding Zn-ribbon protein